MHVKVYLNGRLECSDMIKYLIFFSDKFGDFAHRRETIHYLVQFITFFRDLTQKHFAVVLRFHVIVKGIVKV